MTPNAYLAVHVLFIFNVQFALALIPKICVHNATTTGICCPTSKWGEVCGGFERGICNPIILRKGFKPMVFLNDDRMDWPSRFFHTLCECKGNYFGISCEECFFGMSGQYCEEKVTEVRRNILSLSRRERKLLVDIIDRSITEPSEFLIFIEQHNSRSDPIVSPEWISPSVQYLMVFNHRFSSRATLFTNNDDCQNFGFLDFNHNAVGFLTWHRYFMLVWEKELKKIAVKYFKVHNFALPYWDWIDLNHCDICTNDLLGAEGFRHPEYGVLIHPSSPFHNWTEYCVEPTSDFPCYGCHKAGFLGRISRSWNNLRFPTSNEISFALERRKFVLQYIILSILFIQFSFYVHNERLDQGCQSFHMAIEGLCGRPGFNDSRFYIHNRIHNMLDGSMCCSGTSPSDPLFIVHHTQIDRLFQVYFRVKFRITLSPTDNNR